VLATIVGLPLGALLGSYGGAVDHVIMRLLDIFLACPLFLLAMVIRVMLAPSTCKVVIALGIGCIPLDARSVRGSVLSVKTRTDIEAAKARAVRDWHLLWRHSLPNGMASLIVTSTLSVGTSRIVGASLRFLGLGTQPPTPSWGWDVQAKRTALEGNQ